MTKRSFVPLSMEEERSLPIGTLNPSLSLKLFYHLKQKVPGTYSHLTSPSFQSYGALTAQIGALEVALVSR